MFQMKLLRLKKFYTNILLILVFAAILLLNSISLLIVPRDPNSSDATFDEIRDLIWSNESMPILSPRDACSLPANTSSQEILVMVPSGLTNYKRRAAIRKSWGDTALVREGKIKVVFVLGQKLSTHGASQVICHENCPGRNELGSVNQSCL